MQLKVERESSHYSLKTHCPKQMKFKINKNMTMIQAKISLIVTSLFQTMIFLLQSNTFKKKALRNYLMAFMAAGILALKLRSVQIDSQLTNLSLKNLARSKPQQLKRRFIIKQPTQTCLQKLTSLFCFEVWISNGNE